MVLVPEREFPTSHSTANNITAYVRIRTLNKKLLYLNLHAIYNRFKVGRFICCNGTCYNRARNPTGTTKGNFAWHEYVRNIFVFAQQWEMQEDLDRLCVSCHDDQFRKATVQRLGCLICTFLGLTIGCGLLNKVEERDSKIGWGERVGFFRHFTRGR